MDNETIEKLEEIRKDIGETLRRFIINPFGRTLLKNALNNINSVILTEKQSLEDMLNDMEVHFGRD